MVSYTEELAQFVAEFRNGDLSEEVIEAAKMAILDHLACGISGSVLPWTKMMLSVLGRSSRSPERDERSVIYCQKTRVDAQTAALMNATSSHGYELDDVLLANLIHPGSVVIPAALSTGIELDVTGRQLIEAIVAGYEVLARVSSAGGTWASHYGFHTTGTHGPLGSATAAGLLRGFDAKAFVHVWGVAASMGGGIKAFQKGGGMVKRLHGGMAASNGVLAAEIVDVGFEGPADGLCGESGFLEIYGGPESAPELLVKDKGEHLAITDAYFKLFSSCAVTHPAAQAAQKLRERVPKDWVISRVEIGTCKRGVDQNGIKNVVDIMSLQYSLEYTTALSFLGFFDDLGSTTLDDARRPEVVDLVSRTDLRHDQDAEDGFPTRLAATITMEFENGQQMTEIIHDVMDRQREQDLWPLVIRKFRALTKELLTTKIQDAIVQEVRALDARDNLHTLAEYVSFPQN